MLKGAVAATTLSSLAGVGSAQADGSDSSAERYIIGTESNDAASSMGARASSVERVLDFGSVGSAVVGEFAGASASDLESDSDVRYVERDRTYEASDQRLPWGVDRIDADTTANTGNTGSGAEIAILDSGIDRDHPDLEANLGDGRSFVDYTSSWDDDFGHGTHCAGIAAAVDNGQGVVGVAPEATLHAGKVLGDNGYGSWSAIAAGIEWAANQGYDVINLSLGGTTFSQTLADACTYAYGEGVLPVAAAGNDYGAPVEYPAAYAPVLAVSATTESDSLASYSNVGPDIELAAPGSRIYSTVPDGYGYKSGTSMACPHVSGVAGILMSSGGDDSNERTRSRLRETAEDIDLTGNEQGFGLVDAEATAGNPSIGEVGRVSTDQPDTETWHSVSFTGSYDDAPVVVMKPVSQSHHHETCHVRLRNVTSDGFEYQIEEWSYQDGPHGDEDISYLVFETGTHSLDDGTTASVGRIDGVNDSFETVSTQQFDGTPVVLSQSQTTNGGQPIVTRIKDITSSGFEVRVQEEEMNGAHTDETVGYIALATGQGQTGSKKFEVGRTSNTTENWKSLDFTREYDQSPNFIADMQTFNGGNPATVQYRDLRTTGVDVHVEEEQSKDSETSHAGEKVGFISISEEGTI